jgi:transposase InsO family protein
VTGADPLQGSAQVARGRGGEQIEGVVDLLQGVDIAGVDLGEQADQIKFMIRDRGSNFTGAFDAVLADAGIRTVLCNIRTPRMNAIAERWIGGCRRELLDRTLILNQAHLRRILSDYETHHSQHRPHRSLSGAAPLKPLPEPVDLDLYRIRRQAQVRGLVNEYRLVA